MRFWNRRIYETGSKKHHTIPDDVKKIMDVYMKEFAAFEVLGQGSFGLVVLSKHKMSRQVSALKIQDKQQIFAQQLVQNVIWEKRILSSCRSPFIMRLYYSFKDNIRLFLATEFIQGGEVFLHLRKESSFSEERSKFYMGQVVLALEYLHGLDIVYRDLKPENMLFDIRGYIKICDFGFAKRLTGRTFSLCGTPEYMAPEIILAQPYGKPVDWWAAGILLYEMNAGFPPFMPDTTIYDTDLQYVRLYEAICQDRAKFPAYFSKNLRDLLRKLLCRNVTQRLGNLFQGVLDIKLHPWFSDMNWLQLYEGTVTAEWKPIVSHETDCQQFSYFRQDKELIAKAVEAGRHARTNLLEKEFADF